MVEVLYIDEVESMDRATRIKSILLAMFCRPTSAFTVFLRHFILVASVVALTPGLVDDFAFPVLESDLNCFLLFAEPFKLCKVLFP
jgi:hypothetical protein